MKSDVVRQWTNVVAFLVMLVVNILSNALPFNGLTAPMISDRFDIYFVPAGYAFSIWGLIYLGLTAFVIYQALPSQRDNPRLRRIGYWFVVSCTANIAWLFLWHYAQFPLSVLVMASLLVSLIVIYQRLGTGRTSTSTPEHWFVRLPFSLYMGWISVATIANATELLDFLNWNGWGIAPQTWAVIMLAIGVGLALVMSLTRGDAAYLLVLAWAFAAIGVKQADTPLVATSAWLAAGAAGVLALVGALLARRRLASEPAA